MPLRRLSSPLLLAVLATVLAASAGAVSSSHASPEAAGHAGTPEDPMPVSVGETIQAEMPFGDAFDTEVVFEVTAESPGLLRILVRSLEFDPYLEVTRIAPEGKPRIIRACGPAAWEEYMPDNNRICDATFRDVEPGDRFRIKVQPEGNPYCGGAFEISLAEDNSWEAEQRPYWKHALAHAKEIAKVECEIRALLLESRHLSRDGRRASAAERLPIAKRALDLAREALGPDHPLVAASLAHVAALTSPDDTAGAKEKVVLNDEALSIYEAALGSGHPSVSLVRVGQAHALAEAGRIDDAEKAMRRALADLVEILGPDHLLTGKVMRELSFGLVVHGRYEEAFELDMRALEITEKNKGAYGMTWPPLNAIVLSATLIGSIDTARELAERWLEVETLQHQVPDPIQDEICEGRWRPSIALADLYRKLGQYEKSREQGERALEVAEAMGDSRGRFHAHMALGAFHGELGDYRQAEFHFGQALEIDPDRGMLLQRYVPFLLEVGRHEEVRQLGEKLLRMWQQGLSPDHPSVAIPLHLLGVNLRKTGEFEEARRHLEEALRIRTAKLPADHPATAETRRELAELLREMGLLTEARESIQRALASSRSLLGDEHPAVSRGLHTLATIHAAAGERGEALEAALEAEAIGREHLSLVAGSLTERAALRFASVRTSGLDLALSLAAEAAGSVPGAARSAWNALIGSRALILDEMGARNRIAARSTDTEIIRLFERRQEAARRLANLYLREIQKRESPELYQRRIEEARRDKEQVEKELAVKSNEFARDSERKRQGLSEVASVLPAGGALVAFALYDRADPAGKKTEPVPSYLAFVMRRGSFEPVLVPLGPAEKIDRLVETWKASIGTGERGMGLVSVVGSVKTDQGGQATESAIQAYRDAGAALRRLVWDPVAGAIGDSKHVFIVPDGALSLVSFAALPAEESGYLLEKGPRIHYLSSERDLVRPGDRRDRGGSLLALGGADFGASEIFAALAAEPEQKEAEKGTATAALRAPADEAAGVAVLRTFRGRRSSCGDLKVFDTFEPLPSSAGEVAEIVSLWRGTGRSRSADAAALLTGPDASETAFKRMARGRSVLHLATHGFFLGGQCRSALDASRGFGGLATAGGKAAKQETAAPPTADPGENPLLLSGLVLAGANHRHHAGPDEDDGILTAQEIAAMDLSGVEWAVLSACDTGVGAIEIGEGVFGLRRAFQVAGAGTLIMSLWSVEDESARQWMKALYEGRLKKDLDTAEAVRHASLTVLNDRREKGLPDHPFYWAGFVAAGDWR